MLHFKRTQLIQKCYQKATSQNTLYVECLYFISGFQVTPVCSVFAQRKLQWKKPQKYCVSHAVREASLAHILYMFILDGQLLNTTQITIWNTQIFHKLVITHWDKFQSAPKGGRISNCSFWGQCELCTWKIK